MQEQDGAARLLIVDDHAFMRAGVKATLSSEDDLEIVGEARDGFEAISLCEKLDPDLVLMDVSMPGMDGIEATQKIKEKFPKTSVLMFTAHADEALMMRAVKAGAAGYVLKGDDTRRMVESLRGVLSGETPLEGALAMRILRRIASEEASPQRAPQQQQREAIQNPLTPRETEVLELLATGKTNRQLAQELHISLSTAKRHIERVIAKLGVSDRTQAAVVAIEMGIISGGVK